MTKSVSRLYNSFQPEHYNLSLDINKDALTFTGTVTIAGRKVGKPSERITFHQKGLKITKATVTKHDKSGDQPFEISRINNQDSFDEVRLHADTSLYPGEYTVVMEFEGEITKPMNGIYPCFFEHDGQAKKLIATQFESHHAREAFPCVDEPEAKATFDLTLITNSGETVLSNTPVKESSVDNERCTTTFETTPRMSTYLLAFVTGDLGYEESKTKNGTVVRSYATPDNAALTAYSVDVAVRVLEFFEDYFGVAYPLAKLDMVALPDFSSGAMENWGLVTYRESVMLVDEQSTSIETRQQVALVIAHELSHQWFGNLVTMKWWDDLWLNESFANMMEYRAIDEIYPEWNIWEQFVSHEGVSAKRRDSLADVQSVHTEVNHPDEISTLFDPSIVYAKGGTLLHMLMHHLGEEDFRTGLQAYFKKHQFGNTIADDLWAALSETSGQDVGAFMENWLSRPVYPLVTIDWEPGANTIAITQERFLSDPNSVDANKTTWQVPLAATESVAPSLLDAKQAAMVIENSSADTLLFNHDGTSYFLPQYTNKKHLAQISKSVSDNKVSTIDRLLLLDNYILLQRGGQAHTTQLIDLARSFTNETNENVWASLATSIAEGRKLVEGDEKAEEALNTIVRDLVVPHLDDLGWIDNQKDSAQTLRLRGLLYSMAVGAKHQPTIDEALAKFSDFKKPNDLAASTRGIIYYAGARYGTNEDFNRLLELYKSINSADEKDEIASALTSVKNADHYSQLIGLLKTDTIRRQDLMHWFAWLLRNRYSRADAWNWLQENWSWIEHEFRSDKSYGYFARFAGGVFSRETELASYREFFADKRDVVALARDIVLAEQDIVSRVAWRERNEKATLKYLHKL